jgi:predicted TIM-barrel fold metal-dependent hydrolase
LTFSIKIKMKTITLEEHFATASFLKACGTYGSAAPELKKLQTNLLDLGDARLAAMDEAGVDLQVLSLAAMGFDALDVTTATPLARDINDELASAVRAHPDRFAGFATLALKDPASAAKELERCIRTLGFKGVLINGTTGGEFLDQPQFLPVLEAAQALGVPVYLHPAPPPKAARDAYFSGLPGEIGQLLSLAGWGWHAETALHSLRLIVSGLFTRLPNLQVIIGHMGEGIPYALARSNSIMSTVTKQLPQTLAEYFHQNFHVTTSGYFTVPPFQCALEVVGIDRLMYSVDYPFSSNTQGQKFLESLTLSPADMAKLTHTNAQDLLKL